MPFGLKNVGSTYQRLIKKMSADKLGKTMEVNIDDMLVNSEEANQHVHHLNQTFEIFRKYNMNLNPTKCQFGVTARKLLDYLITKRGIEANPNQIRLILNIAEPQNNKDVQKLYGRLEALTKFIPKA